MDNMVTIELGGGTRQSIPKEHYERQVTAASELLSSDYIGYLNIRELYELHGLVNKTAVIQFTNVEKAKQRIDRLRAADIPSPYIVEDEVVEGSLFPFEDFVIQFPTGRLFERWRGMFANSRGRKVYPRIYPSSLEDIIDFRTKAYDGEVLSTEVIRDALGYLQTKLEQYFSPDEVAQIHEFSLLELKAVGVRLQGVTPGERAFSEFLEGDPLSFVSRYCWHVDYEPATRCRIALDYKQRLIRDRRSLGSEKKPKTRKRMRNLFPDILDEDHHLLVEQNRSFMEQCKAQEDYRGMPQIVLIDSAYDSGRYVAEIKDHLDRACDKLIRSSPRGIFGNINSLNLALHIPPGLQYLPDFHDVITRKRLEAARGMNDAEFSEHFVELQPQKTAALGHRNYAERTSLDLRFIEYIKERSARLCSQ